VSGQLSNDTDKEGKNVELTMTDADKKALDTDYAEGEVSREEAKRYPLVHRGSVRLVMDLYRTESEQRQFIDEGVRLRLPGQEGYRRKHTGIWGSLRSFFERLKAPRRAE
jgi:hypothetical protein